MAYSRAVGTWSDIVRNRDAECLVGAGNLSGWRVPAAGSEEIMAFGEHLSRCLKCGKSFICGDCIEMVCQECKDKHPTIAAYCKDLAAKSQEEALAKDMYFAGRPYRYQPSSVPLEEGPTQEGVKALERAIAKLLIDIAERDRRLERLQVLYDSACDVSEQRRKSLAAAQARIAELEKTVSEMGESIDAHLVEKLNLISRVRDLELDLHCLGATHHENGDLEINMPKYHKAHCDRCDILAKIRESIGHTCHHHPLLQCPACRITEICKA
jgi:hypothetical protein